MDSDAPHRPSRGFGETRKVGRGVLRSRARRLSRTEPWAAPWLRQLQPDQFSHDHRYVELPLQRPPRWPAAGQWGSPGRSRSLPVAPTSPLLVGKEDGDRLPLVGVCAPEAVGSAGAPARCARPAPTRRGRRRGNNPPPGRAGQHPTAVARLQASEGIWPVKACLPPCGTEEQPGTGCAFCELYRSKRQRS